MKSKYLLEGLLAHMLWALHMEQEAWEHTLGSCTDFHEVFQSSATHDGPHSRARLDRIYSTQHTAAKEEQA